MTTTIPQASAAARPLAQMKPKEQIAHLLQSKRGEIAKMLPKHLNAERLLKVAQIAATTTPALAKCDVASLVGAIGQCAQMGLEPNTVLGHAYLVPFNTKRKDAQGVERWVNSVQVIIGYKGLIDLARRSGQIVSIAAHEVCEQDTFDLVYGLDEKLEHRPAMGERGEVIGFYAVAKLKDGGHCFEFMSRLQVEQIMAGTQSKGKYGPWKDNFTEMGRKTVIRRLAKYLPLSIEFQTAAALDGMAEAGKDQNLDNSNIIDGEFTMMPDDMPHGDDQQQDGAIDSAAAPAASAQAPAQPPAIGYSAPELLAQMLKAKSPEKLDEVASFIGDLPDQEDRKNLNAKYEALRAEMPGA
ncbi:recombinase RecT [Delftia acidovorans]|uniref:recombinase RecT n=1 Tax=Delftia acidovorans TaxID=80866 RepID=UPI0018E8D961|nr:recombinase RecT [Delftia acidovorans]MBJ2142574.1 recombinase RecT [Delftia acidovorans]